MLAFLDDQPLTLERATFACALATASDAARGSGRIVSQVWLDGAPVGAAILKHPPELPLGKEVRVVSQAPATVSEGETGLGSARAALGRASAAQAQAADLIQTARVEESLRPLAEAIGAWQEVQETVSRELSWAAGLESFEAMLEELAAKLREVQRSLGAQDWSALSDVLAYDMKEQAAGWGELIDGVAESSGAGSRE